MSRPFYFGCKMVLEWAESEIGTLLDTGAATVTYNLYNTAGTLFDSGTLPWNAATRSYYKLILPAIFAAQTLSSLGSVKLVHSDGSELRETIQFINPGSVLS